MDDKSLLELGNKLCDEMKKPEVIGLAATLARHLLEKYPEDAKAICALVSSFVLRAQTNNDDFLTHVRLQTWMIESSPEDITELIEKRSVVKTQH